MLRKNIKLDVSFAEQYWTPVKSISKEEALELKRKEEIEKKQLFDAHEIIPKMLWLGSYSASQNFESLEKNGITRIISVMARSDLVPNGNSSTRITRMIIPIDDVVDAPIHNYLHEAIAFIDESIATGKPVLVHCMMGISRSATIVLAYLMKTERLTFETAFTKVKKIRTCIDPNIGFIHRLLIFETAENLTVPASKKINCFW